MLRQKLRLLKSTILRTLGIQSPEVQTTCPEEAALTELLRQLERAVPTQEAVDTSAIPEELLVKYEADIGYQRPFYYYEDLPYPVTNMYDQAQKPTSLPEAAVCAVVYTKQGFVAVGFTSDNPKVEFHTRH